MPPRTRPVAEKPEPAAERGMTHQGVSNASPVLPGNAQASAARAHALFEHFIKLCEEAKADIEKYVPAELLHAAEIEIAALIRSIL